MAKSKNQKGKGSKPSVKVGDLKPGQDPKGGYSSKVDFEYKDVIKK